MACKHHNRIEYKENSVIGKCLFIKEIDSKFYNSGGRIRMGLFICPYCNKKFESAIHLVKKGDSESCGCYGRKRRTDAATKHGYRQTRAYSIWNNIKQRCYNKNNKSYKWYGGRGIAMCDEWKNDLGAFGDFVTRLPNYKSSKYTLDRIDNYGNYEPGNVRFVTQRTQVINSRSRSGNTSKYRGVFWDKKVKKWKVTIKPLKSKVIVIGWFKKEIDGAIARDNYIIEHKLLEYPLQVLDREVKN